MFVRILHVVAAGEYGGAEAQILTALDGLRRAGDEVAVVTYYDGEFARRAEAAGISTRRLATRPLYGDYAGLVAVARDYRPDIIHTHGTRANVAGRFAGRRLHVPVVTTVHSDLYFDYRSPIKRELFMALEALTRHLSQRVIAVSRPLLTLLESRGYRRDRLMLIENGLDVAAADRALLAAAEHPARLREERGVSPQATVVVCVARLHPVKNHALLIEAFGRAAVQSGAEAYLALVGDGEERARLEAQAAEMAPGRVWFLGSRSDVYAILREADVFALVSKMEGLPLAPIEAMAAELPVIATRVGGLADIVEGGVGGTGLLVESGDARGLAEALQQLLDQTDERKQMGRRGREHAESRYSSLRVVDQLRDAYGFVKF